MDAMKAAVRTEHCSVNQILLNAEMSWTRRAARKAEDAGIPGNCAELLAGCSKEPTLTAHLCVMTLLPAVFPSEILAGDVTTHTEGSSDPLTGRTATYLDTAQRPCDAPKGKHRERRRNPLLYRSPLGVSYPGHLNTTAFIAAYTMRQMSKTFKANRSNCSLLFTEKSLRCL